jgi:hypothetical protein
MVYPLYRQEGPISHICLSNETYARFPRDGGSVCSPAGSICECEEGEWSDLVDEETTRNLLVCDALLFLLFRLMCFTDQ